jgi:hypothetical protein
MSRVSFRDSVLGPWASHPATLRSRALKWSGLSFLPLAAGLLIFFFAWRFGAVSLLTLAQQWDTWLPLALALVALGFSSAVTCLLVARASTVPAFQSGERAFGSLRVWTFLAGTGLLSAFAFAFTRSDFLGAALSADGVARVRIVGHLLGTLPIFVLLVYLEFAGAAVDEWGEGGAKSNWKQIIRRCFVVLTILAGYVLPMVWIDRIAASLDSYLDHLKDPQAVPADQVAEEILRWVPWLTYEKGAGQGTPVLDVMSEAQNLISAIAILVPLGCMAGFVVSIALSFVRRAKATKQPVAADRVATIEGFNVRPAGEAWAPNGKGARPRAERWEPLTEQEALEGNKGADAKDSGSEEDSSEEGEDSAPEWLSKLREQVAERASLEWGSARRAALPEFSPAARRPDLSHLFATAFDCETGETLLPTKDQVDALEQFDLSFEEFLRAEDHEGQCVFPSMDLLVKGPPGSGRTTLLLAVAMNSVVLRGQSVLIVVPTQHKAELFVRKLRDLASRSGVGWHVSVGRIRSDDVRSWADPIEAIGKEAEGAKSYRSPLGSAPDILVGTPQEYEQHLYGADFHFAVVRRALLRMQVVLVEDLSTFDARERRHLPFLLEKHRVVLASEHLPTQFLALAPDLTDDSADYLTERLFSERSRVPCKRLRPPERNAPWTIDVAADETDEALEQLCQVGQASGLRLVIWRPGAAMSDRSMMQERLGGARVVSDLDELEPEDGLNVDLAVYRSMTAQQHTLALASHVPGEGAVLVRVTRSGSLAPRTEQTHCLPVLPSVDAEALFVSHLASAIRFVGASSPAPRDVFARLGLKGAGRLVGLAQREPSFSNFPGYTLQIDPPEHQAKPVSASRGQTWAWVALRVEGNPEMGDLPIPTPRPVELLRPFPRNRQLRADSMQDRFHLGEARMGDEAIAYWRTQQNESLDRMDLAFADDLLHRHGDALFFPQDIRQEGEAIQIGGAPFRDRDGGESFMPVLEAELHIPSDLRVDFSQGGLAPDAMRWSEIREAAATGDRVDAQFWIVGTFDVNGSLSRLSRGIPVQYPVRVGMLALGASIEQEGTIQVDRDERTRASLAGNWTTRREQHARESSARMRSKPWPALGMALTAALRESLHGIFDYTRLIAHRGPLDGVNDRRAFVFFVEPSATRGTVGSVMRKLLQDEKMTKRLLQCALEILADVHLEDPDPFSRLMGEAKALVGSGWYDDTSSGRQQAAEDLENARALLESVLALLERTEQRAQRVREQKARREGRS